MPWSVSNPPDVAKNWTEAEKRKCVAAANAVLKETGDEKEAIFACIHAAGKSTGEKREVYRPMERKVFPAIVTKVYSDQGVVEQIVAVMGNLDLGDDIIWPGAFTKTLAERGNKIKVLDQHRTDSVLCVVGKPLEIREIGRNELPPELLKQYPEATGGLWTKTQYLLEAPEGLGVFIRLKEGAIDEASIGYDALDTDYSMVTSNGKQMRVRNLRTIKLYEYSPVIWGMNPATTTLSAKETEELKKDAESVKEMTLQGPMPRMGDVLMSRMHKAVMGTSDQYLEKGMISGDEHKTIMQCCIDMMDMLQKSMSPDMASRGMRPEPGFTDFYDYFYMAANPPEGFKIGFVPISVDNIAPQKAPSEAAVEKPEPEEKAGPVDQPPTSPEADELKMIELELETFSFLEV